MSYSSEVIRLARIRLEEKKDQRLAEQRRRLTEAYSRIPELRSIDRDMRLSMAKAMQSAFLKGEEGQALIAQAKEQNTLLRRQREALIRDKLPAGWLDSSPACSLCSDTGYIGTAMCECLNELCRQEQRKKLGRLSGGNQSFEHFRLDLYPDRIDQALGVSIRKVMEHTLAVCRSYAESFSLASGNLLLSGDTGLGKTFISGCIAGAAADKGYSVVYESAPELFGRMERAKFDADQEARRESVDYSDCDLLVIDDIGTEMPSQFVTASLYGLINERLMQGKPMIISTNLTSEDFAKRYSPQIASRLRGSFRRVLFIGEDIRVLKNRGIV